MNNLISVGDLLGQSWSHHVKFFKENVRVVLIGLIPSFIMALVQAFASYMPIGIYGTLTLLLTLASFVTGIWMTIVLSKMILKQDGATLKNDRKWTSYLIPLLLIAIVTGFLVLLGFMFFILPGIWLAVALSYSQYLLLEDDLDGTHAVQGSYDLVKGRWWAVFGRSLLVGIVYGFAFTIVMVVLGGILALALSPLETNMKAGFSTFAFNGLTAVLTPLFTIVSVKLFHSLKKTKISMAQTAPVA